MVKLRKRTSGINPKTGLSVGKGSSQSGSGCRRLVQKHRKILKKLQANKYHTGISGKITDEINSDEGWVDVPKKFFLMVFIDKIKNSIIKLIIKIKEFFEKITWKKKKLSN